MYKQNNKYINNKEYSIYEGSSSKNTRTNDVQMIEDSSSTKDTENKNHILIGACIGAGVVITILIFVFIGYRLYVKKHENKSKKHRSSVVGSTGVQSRVTLLPIRGFPIREHSSNQRGVARLPGNMTSPLARLPSNKNIMTSPPPYHESFLDNRNSF